VLPALSVESPHALTTTKATTSAAAERRRVAPNRSLMLC
jgi:hypothetical protein